jgi:hypothetical protein
MEIYTSGAGLEMGISAGVLLQPLTAVKVIRPSMVGLLFHQVIAVMTGVCPKMTIFGKAHRKLAILVHLAFDYPLMQNGNRSERAGIAILQKGLGNLILNYPWVASATSMVHSQMLVPVATIGLLRSLVPTPVFCTSAAPMPTLAPSSGEAVFRCGASRIDPMMYFDAFGPFAYHPFRCAALQGNMEAKVGRGKKMKWITLASSSVRYLFSVLSV